MGDRIGHFRANWKDSTTRKIEPDFLTRNGFLLCRPCQVWGTPNCNWYNKSLDIEIYNHNDTGQWLWTDYDRLTMVYESDLLRLIEWVKSCRGN